MISVRCAIAKFLPGKDSITEYIILGFIFRKLVPPPDCHHGLSNVEQDFQIFRASCYADGYKLLQESVWKKIIYLDDGGVVIGEVGLEGY